MTQLGSPRESGQLGREEDCAAGAKTDADDPLKRQAAERALFHLYRVSRKKAS